MGEYLYDKIVNILSSSIIMAFWIYGHQDIAIGLVVYFILSRIDNIIARLEKMG